MALAYAVIFVDQQLWHQQRAAAIHQAQRAADDKFRAIAEDNMKALVTRNPEPREMTYPEMRKLAPTANLDGLVGLYFTADIA